MNDATPEPSSSPTEFVPERQLADPVRGFELRSDPGMKESRADTPQRTAGWEPPAAGTNEPSIAGAIQPSPYPSVPNYTILGELGRGGMGVVYKAWQVGLKREVALKMILAKAHAAADMQTRFRQEAEAVARLRHPNIVQIYDIGAHDGLPYFALEFVGGGSLAQRLRREPQQPREAALISETLARAIHYAHEQKIVHRDLKPANVLLSVPLVPSVPFVPSSLKITDFGLAKQLDASGDLTASGAIFGTPSYMAPEQAAGQVRLIGPRTDVYALGAILYEMLTGRPPFHGANVPDTLIQVQSQEPVPVRQLQPMTPRDLETICLKCLRKEADRRYHSAQALADDLRRFVDGQPILARPVGALERAGKWMRRKPAVAALLAAVGVAVAVGFVLVFWQWQRAEIALVEKGIEADRAGRAEFDAKQKANAESAANAAAQAARTTAQEKQTLAENAATAEAKARAELERRGYFNLIQLADREWTANNLRKSGRYLDECPPHLRDWEWYCLKKRFEAAKDTFDVATPSGLPGSSSFWAVSPDRRRWVFMGKEGIKNTLVIKVWNALEARVEQSLSVFNGWPNGVAFGPEGRWLAVSLEQDKTWQVRIWDLATGREQARIDNLMLQGPAFGLSKIAAPPDGAWLAVPRKGKMVLFDPLSGKELHSFVGPESCTFVTASGDGGRLAAGDEKGGVWLWDVKERRELFRAADHFSPVNCLAFAPNAKVLASGGYDGSLKVWDGDAAHSSLTLWRPGYIEHVGFSPDGKRLVATNMEYFDRCAAQIWDAATGREQLTVRGYGKMGVVFTADGRQLMTVDSGQINYWDAVGGQESQTIARDGAGKLKSVVRAAVSSDRRLVATADTDDQRKTAAVHIWELPSGRLMRSLPGSSAVYWDVAFSADGKYLAVVRDAAEEDSTRKISKHSRRLPKVLVMEVATGRIVLKLTGHHGLNRCIAFSPDGKLLATGGSFIEANNQTGEARIWEVQTGKLLHTLRKERAYVDRLAFSPDGRELLVVARYTEAIGFWDVVTGKEIGNCQLHAPRKVGTLTENYQITALTFTPDGSRLAVGCTDGFIDIVNLAKREAERSFAGPGDAVHAITISPDSARLAASSSHLQVQIKLWDFATGQEVLTLDDRTSYYIPALVFTADGRQLLSIGNETKIWDARIGTENGTLRGHTAGVLQVGFAGDGQAMVTIGQDGKVRRWDATKRRELATPLPIESAVKFSVQSPDESKLATVHADQSFIVRSTADPESVLFRGKVGSATAAVAFGADSRQLVVADGLVVRRIDLAKGQEIGSFQALHLVNDEVQLLTVVAVSPDSKLIATGIERGSNSSEEGKAEMVALWDADTGQRLRTLRGYEGRVSHLRFSPDGRLLFGASASRINYDPSNVVCWDVASGRELYRLPVGGYSGVAIALSRDGKQLAVALEQLRSAEPLSSRDGEVLVYDLAAFRVSHVLRGHLGAVRGLAFRADGRWLATASDDGTAKLWDLQLPHEPERAEKATRNWHETLVADAEGRQDWPAAAEHLRRLIAAKPNDWRLHARLGSALSAHRAWDQAAAAFQKAIEVGANEHWLWYQLACGRLHAGDVASYRQACDTLVKKFGQSKDPKARMEATWTCCIAPNGIADYAQLLASAKATVEAEPGNAWNWTIYGMVLYRAGRYAEALTQLDESQKRGGGLWTTLFSAMTHHRLGHAAEARALVGQAWQILEQDQAVRDEPNLPKTETPLAWWNRVEFELLRDEAMQLLQWQPPAWWKPAHHATALLRIGQYDRAAELFAQAMELKADEWWLWHSQALCSLHSKKGTAYPLVCASLLRRFGDAKEPGDASFIAWVCLMGECRQEDLPRVLALAESAMRASPQVPNYRSTYASAIYRAGRYAEAVTKLTEACQAYPDKQGTVYDWFFLAMAHHRLGHAEEASRWFDKATEWLDAETEKSDQGQGTVAWWKLLELQLLRDEADMLMQGQPLPTRDQE